MIHPPLKTGISTETIVPAGSAIDGIRSVHSCSRASKEDSSRSCSSLRSASRSCWRISAMSATAIGCRSHDGEDTKDVPFHADTARAEITALAELAQLTVQVFRNLDSLHVGKAAVEQIAVRGLAA